MKQAKHQKQSSQIFENNQRGQRKLVFDKVSTFKVQSNSVIPSSRKHKNLEQNGPQDLKRHLPQLGNFHIKSSSVKPDIIGVGNFTSSKPHSLHVSPISMHQKPSTRFATNVK